VCIYLFVLYTFLHMRSCFDQIWYSRIGPRWEGCRYLKIAIFKFKYPQKSFRKVQRTFCSCSRKIGPSVLRYSEFDRAQKKTHIAPLVRLALEIVSILHFLIILFFTRGQQNVLGWFISSCGFLTLPNNSFCTQIINQSIMY
jgi:hypothetical protein